MAPFCAMICLCFHGDFLCDAVLVLEQEAAWSTNVFKTYQPRGNHQTPNPLIHWSKVHFIIAQDFANQDSYTWCVYILQTYSDESNQSKKTTKDHHQTKQAKNTHQFTNTLQQTNKTVEIPPFAWLPHGALAWAPQPCQGASGSWSPTCDSGELPIKQHNFMDTTGYR